MRLELVERARNGDRDAFAVIASEQANRMYAIARLVLRDPDLAYDAAQEALIRCWRQLPGLRQPERFDGWLTRITVRAAADEAGRRNRFQANIRPLSVETTVDDRSADIEDRELLEAGFRRLSVAQRAVVVLHHYEGLSLPEVAKVLDIPVGTAQSRYHYAIAALRAALDADARTSAPREVPA